ncbi:MAG: HU family DNA-binding protein [Desulfovibrio sp.]|nr:HU family DNA-binding protein [Desulfovibrio sp.]
MTKADFISKIAAKTDLSKSVTEKIINCFVDVVSETLRDEGRLALANFGTFSVSERKERQGRNPQTGAPLTIPACKVVKFHAGKQLRDAVN